MIYPCFKDKVALITGGTRGIGRQTAELLADSGAHLALVYRRDRASADAAQEELEAHKVPVLTIKADIADRNIISEIIAQVHSRFGQLDFLVSNAAFGVLKPIGEYTAKQFDAAMNANARAYLLLAQAAADMMVPLGTAHDSPEHLFGTTHKRIVALSSLGSRKVIPGYAAVGASKAAIESLTAYLAVELANRGIGVNAVAGGLVQTDALQAFKDSSQWLNDQVKRTPMGRIAEPREIAEVVVWLLSDQARWITGQTIVADGGLSLV
jgi:enoyl-[acyl-carrier protein] reductase III